MTALKPAAALQQLYYSPSKFLAENLLRMSTGEPSGIETFRMGYSQSYVVGDANATPAYKIALIEGVPPIATGVQDVDSPQDLDAHQIAVIEASSLTYTNGTIEIPAYLLSNTSVLDLMVTTQLTGCVFCYAKVSEGLLCAHVRPAPSPEYGAGKRLQNLLMEEGRFAGHEDAAISFYGQLQYKEASANVVGVLAAWSWEIYAQRATDKQLFSVAHLV